MLSEQELDELSAVVADLYLDEMRAMKPHPPGRITLEADETVVDYGDLKMLLECAAAMPALIAAARDSIRYRALLEEASEWLCPHTDALEAWKKGAGRSWCCDCRNYIRSDEDATLKGRVSAALTPEASHD